MEAVSRRDRWSQSRVRRGYDQVKDINFMWVGKLTCRERLKKVTREKLRERLNLESKEIFKFGKHFRKIQSDGVQLNTHHRISYSSLKETIHFAEIC